MAIDNKKPAVFLDRDGVLIKENGYITSVEKMEVFSYTAECIRKIHEKGYYAIVVTNQSGIARGLFTEEKIKELNIYLIRQIGVDEIFYCPHYVEGNIKKYSKECRCRKPEPGMFEMANRKFNIDMKKSYMVGDRASDIIAGKRAFLKTILLESGYGTARLEKNVNPDYIFQDLRDVIKIL